MKLISTLFENKTMSTLVAALFLMGNQSVQAQVSTVCTNPTNVAYGLTQNGEIDEIDASTGATLRVIKNTTYTGNGAAKANALGYNSVNSKFYYFKRNIGQTPQEFVSFTPATNTVVKLANSSGSNETHTGCVTANGSGYYTVDIMGAMHYYNIASNTWTAITTKIVDQYGNNISTLITTQNAGDMAIDGLGNLWLVTSSASNYGLYKFPANLPTTAQAQVNVVRWINPTTPTPTGQSIRGIAFKPNGEILMTTGDNKLYLLKTVSSLVLIGNLTTSDIGNDLTACAFPQGILPVNWKSFGANLNGSAVILTWEVIEYQNKGFYVEHSQDGENWEDLGFLQGKNDPSVIQKYTFNHFTKVNGKHFYRIRQVDIDDRTSYSEIASVTINNISNTVSVFPNPASSTVRVLGGSNLNRTRIFDLSGRIISEKSLQNSNTISISDLPVGTYVIRIETTTGLVYNEKIVKQ